MMTLILLAAMIVIAGGVWLSLRQVQPEAIRVRVRDRVQPRRWYR
ncbi:MULTISPECIES: hypothetical protein [Chloroflexus]|jgi:hypothetical protein|uniref:Uncharacterized protein n=1 Tax=Chloroflexus aggregans (strain MD-66 / DSM 9485) TaxID=326427 RepID=B8G832_CHLAD|nr:MULTISPECIES: hypothetical protein [Chloroflexus]ACL26086.1 hypothetical protein Cagg_3228 [Chloroflexus aggregans DSM 9485]GIV87561.1 MAG: hypothetical protein KatS3mg055_0079 [Chloroflexus sp.]